MKVSEAKAAEYAQMREMAVQLQMYKVSAEKVWFWISFIFLFDYVIVYIFIIQTICIPGEGELTTASQRTQRAS